MGSFKDDRADMIRRLFEGGKVHRSELFGSQSPALQEPNWEFAMSHKEELRRLGIDPMNVSILIANGE